MHNAVNNTEVNGDCGESDILLSGGRRDALAVAAAACHRAPGGHGAGPSAVDQHQAQSQRPRAHGRQQEGQKAVRLQQEVARVRLPGQQQQHEQVHRQAPPAAARAQQQQRAEGVAAATQVEAPAQVQGERHVEEEQLGTGGGKKFEEQWVSKMMFETCLKKINK